MLSSRPGGMRRTFGADRTNLHAPLAAPSSENHHVAVQKTPAAAKTPSRRRALGDISNRKAFGGNATTGNAQKQQQQRGVTFTSATKSVSKSVLPSRSSTPYMKNKGSTVTVVATTATPRVTSFVLPPMDDVEFRAGRPFDPFDGYDDEVLDISVDLSMDDCEMLTRSSSMSLKHTPRCWMGTFDNSDQDTMIDDASLMVAPDDVDSFDRIDISLEEEVDFLGVGITDISFE